MNFDVYINGEFVGTYGHPDPESLSISVSGDAESSYLFASAVCREDGKHYHHSWKHVQLNPTDEVRIVPCEQGEPMAPDKRFEMGRTGRKAWESNVCEFCQRNETQVSRLILGDASRPGICSDCVDICNAILESDT